MKKLLCLFLAVLMLVSLAACGTGEGKDPLDTKGDNSQVSEQETVDMDFVCELPDDLNYNNETVNIIYAKATGREDELVSEGLGYGVVSDAVYERNELVQDQLKVVFNLIAEDSSVDNKVSKDIQAGGGEYDLVVNGTYVAITPAMTGKYLDLSGLEYLDPSKHYWTQGYNDMVTFTENKHQYLVSGPVALSMFRLMYTTIYNKTLFEANQETDLYEVVMNGKWTLDYQYSVLKDRYVDSDGDGKVSKNDSYGFVTGNIVSTDPYPVAADIHLIIKDADTYDLAFNGDAVAPISDLIEKVQLIYNDQSTYVFKTATEDDVGKNNIVETFALGKSMMATLIFWNMEHNFSDLASMSYGIAPIPKYSEEQPAYHSYVQDQVSSFGISAGVGDENRQEMLGAVLESLAYHSYRIVRPAYYETSLSSKYMQDPQSAEILDLIFDSLSFDFSSSCSNVITGCVIRDNLRPLLSGSKSTGVSSTIARWEKSVSNALKKYNNSLNALG